MKSSEMIVPENLLEESGFTKKQLEDAILNGVPLQVVLGEVIRSIGVTTYAEIIGWPPQNIHRAIREDSNPTRQTLEQLLKPLNLVLGFAEAKKTHHKKTSISSIG